MRILIHLVILISFQSFGQNSTVELQIKEKHNKLNKGAWEYAWIYNADTTYRQYSEINKRRASFDSLPSDTYTVTIHAKYGGKKHKKNIEIKINHDTSLIFNTKAYPFKKYKGSVPLSSTIKNGDTYSIQYTLNMCRNAMGFTYSEWADITKSNDQYKIRYSDADSSIVKELTIQQVQKLIEANIPMFAICLGHQMLSIAHGFDTYKLKFGQHGGNHPVANPDNVVEITAQNHNYNVPDNIIEIAEITHQNLFDNTIEGVRHDAYKAFSVQYHPEASPGPHDSLYLFDEFVDAVKDSSKVSN